MTERLNWTELSKCEVKVLVTQSHLTLPDPMDCKPARLLCPWDSPGKNSGVACHALLWGNFPTQGWNPGLLHRTCILSHMSPEGSRNSLTSGTTPLSGQQAERPFWPGSSGFYLGGSRMRTKSLIFCFCFLSYNTIVNYIRIQRGFYIFQDVFNSLCIITFEARILVNSNLCRVPCH